MRSSNSLTRALRASASAGMSFLPGLKSASNKDTSRRVMSTLLRSAPSM